MLKVTEVLVTARRTGRAELDEQAEPSSNSEIEVTLKDLEENLANLSNQLSVLKAVTVNIGQPISYRLDHLLLGVRAQITINLISKI
jgi:Cu/Ag efflux pump CusA